jgi:hypothetical protein
MTVATEPIPNTSAAHQIPYTSRLNECCFETVPSSFSLI